MQYKLALIFVLVLVGCAKISIQQNEGVYFGGEIINPKEKIVILYNEDGVVADTLQLDKNNRFFIHIDSVTNGLYSFRHGGEYQMVIMEPQDSIMLRLNTYDFDESLVFSGNGARKNNYLLKIFLQNEKQDRKLVKYSQKDPEEFEEFISRRHTKQIADLNHFIGKRPVSPFAENVLRSSINYNNYADREIYPFAYFGNNRLVHNKDLPQSFYEHRKLVDYNADELSEVFAYNRFLFAHIDNLALKHFYVEHDDHSKFNRHEMSYNKAKLDLIDSLITNETIKNNLLKYKTRDFISHSLDESEINEMLGYYEAKCSNQNDLAYMNRLVSAIDELKPGNDFPELELVDIKNNEHSIAEIIKKPTLIYFWSSNNKKHYRNSHYRVRELKKKFPQVEFVSININEKSDEFWIDILNKYKFSLENEYKFKDPKAARETLALNFVYKVMVVDNEGHILHPNVNIFSENFEDSLEGLLQKKALSI